MGPHVSMPWLGVHRYGRYLFVTGQSSNRIQCMDAMLLATVCYFQWMEGLLKYQYMSACSRIMGTVHMSFRARRQVCAMAVCAKSLAGSLPDVLAAAMVLFWLPSWCVATRLLLGV